MNNPVRFHARLTLVLNTVEKQITQSFYEYLVFSMAQLMIQV